eukprot:CAMPEP_0113730518 /NCGR_PEP_ID=MMETSP0038_2-20120614/43203_1 /TAXON_ID=2898 /ORGANISM="Cryptomonas paramecium" /LENGTH=42 /DNA_ID=CAMNT_0000662587 /DNA_START=202 /DNA_END=330 /DNA_ORIENTATION=+ /assembly_acc=CAM_ASM_000170
MSRSEAHWASMLSKQSIALRWLSRTISMARSMLLPAAGAEPQ